MGTTTNNGWPTPVATDLVKDGWEAIKDLGDAIDTTLGVYSPATPMGVHLSTVTFSGVTSVSSAANTFSSTYTDYFLKIDLTTAGSNEVSLRLRAAGVDATGSNYTFVFNRASGASVAAETNTTTFAVIAPGAETNRQAMQVEIFSPFEAAPTRLYSRFYMVGNPRVGVSGISHSLSTSYDAFTILCSSNISGTYSIYGFNK
jgi:hypothetical protein